MSVMEVGMATHPAGIRNRIANRQALGLLLALIVLLSVSLQPAYAQNCAQCAISAAVDPPVSTSQWTFSKQVNEVNVLFLVSRGGKALGGLSLDDISVQDDGKAPAAILSFRNEQELPLRIALLIDTSSSVASRFRFEQDAASVFLRQALEREEDLAFVMGFENHPMLTQDFTHDENLLSQGVERLHPDGGTALYDAIRTASQKLQRRPEKSMVARVLIVLSDGQNNAGEARLESAIDAAQRAEVTIYAVSTNYGASYSGETMSAESGNQNLRSLAQQTGGRVLMPPSPKAVMKAFAKIGEELRSRYAVSYRPANFVSDGRYRKIKIQVRKPGEKTLIRARKGYFANPTSGTSSESEEAVGNVIMAAR
jgi:VWFA-related protein